MFNLSYKLRRICTCMKIEHYKLYRTYKCNCIILMHLCEFVHINNHLQLQCNKQAIFKLQIKKRFPLPKRFSYTMVQQLPVGQGLLIIEGIWSHSNTPQTVELLWTSGQPDAETSTRQHATLIRDRRACSRRYSNPQYQQVSGCTPKPEIGWPLGSA